MTQRLSDHSLEVELCFECNGTGLIDIPTQEEAKFRKQIEKLIKEYLPISAFRS